MDNLNVETNIVPVPTTEVKKGRGRPKGTVKAETIEARKVHAKNQIEKLNYRLFKLKEELSLVDEKIETFQSFIDS